MSVSAIPGLLPDEANRQAFLALVQALRERRALVLVGAGSSCRLGYPLWSGLASSLEAEILRLHPEKKPRIESLARAKDPMFRISKLKAELGMDAFIPWVRATFGPKTKAFDSFHEELVALPFRHVLTTNYDPVLDETHNSLWKSGKSELVQAAAQVVDWSNLDDVRELFESLHDANYSRRYVHLHGRYNAHKTVILTNDEYQARYRDDARNPRLLEGLFSNFRIVTVGFSFADVELLRIFEDLKRALGSGRPLHFGLLALGDPSDPRDAAVEREQLREQYGIEPLFYPWTADHGELATLVHALLAKSVDAPSESVASAKGRKATAGSAKPTLPAVLPLLLTGMDDSRPAPARMTELLALANVALELGLSRDQIHAKVGADSDYRTGISQSKPSRYCEVGLMAPPLEVTKFQAWVKSEAKVFISVKLRRPAERCTLFCGQPIKTPSVELPLLGRAKKQATIEVLGLEWLSMVLRDKHPALLARYAPEEGRRQIAGYSGTSFERLQQDYFQGIHSRFWELSTLGMPTHARRSKGAWNSVQLASLFVPLRFRPSERIARLAMQKDGSTTLAAVLQAGHSAVLLGDPGTGKTTVLRFLALLFAGPADLQDFSPPAGMVPIFVSLREFVRRRGERIKDGTFDFLDFAVEQARAQEQPDMHRVYFESALMLGRAILLLDGLDEVGSEAARLELRSLLDGFLGRWPLACCIVTSRVFGYEQARLPSERFVELRVEPLSESESQQFVERWYALRCPTDTAQQAELTKSLRQAIGRTPSVRRLASNPLLLTLMAMIHQSEGKLPQYRGELYEYCIKMLLETWPAARRGQASPSTALTVVERYKLDLYPQQSILSRLALHMQEHDGERDQTGRGLIHRAEAVRVLGAAYLGQVKHEQPGLRQPEADARMADFIDYLEEHTGLLIDRGDHLLAFVHLSFQEYLAAWSYHATGAPPESLPAERLLDPAWQEVVLLRLYLLRRKEDPGRLSTALESVFARLRSAPEPAGWLTLTRAIRDELVASPDDRHLILRRAVEHWASLGAWDEQFWPALEEVWLFSEQGRASLRDVLLELGQAEDDWLAVVAVHLAARLNMPLSDLLRPLAGRSDVSQIADELLLLRSPAEVRDFAECHATATGYARLFTSVEGR